MATRARWTWWICAGALLGSFSWWRSRAVEPVPAPTTISSQPREDPALQASEQCAARALHMPDGALPALTCRDARRIIAQVRARLPGPAAVHDPSAFAEALVAWMDPHGLWSAAPDAPIGALMREAARTASLIEDIERSPRDPSPCAAAEALGAVAQSWVGELRDVYLAARRETASVAATQGLALAADSIFEDDPVSRPARQLARELGRRSRAFAEALGSRGQTLADQIAPRLLPELPARGWSEVVLAAAVRAYVPSVDAHGQWAPLEEEWSLYAGETSVDPGPALWGEVMRTAVGATILSDPALPLEEGDLVLEIGGLETGGLSIEQLEQLARLESIGGESTRRVAVVRDGRPQIIELEVAIPAWDEPPEAAGSSLERSRVRYGQGEVLVLSLADVPDNLGEEIAEIVVEANLEQPPPLGIVLDLRGNGGGSPDGASEAIGVFVPGAPSFSLRRRSGRVEVERAAAPPPSAQWRGPVAALVDGHTASAAEMIAAALVSYGRGPVLGTRTFGKGCIQEYFDDRTGSGVLRLTTMLFAQPDGSPLQQVGLEPSIPLPWAAVPEREASLPASMPAWSGPDVRDRAAAGAPRWPGHGGILGPCSEHRVCEALRRLGPAAWPRRPGDARRVAGLQGRPRATRPPAPR